MIAAPPTRTKTVLLIEDEQADVELTGAVLHDHHPNVTLRVISHLPHALEFVDALRRDATRDRPDVVILDLTLHQERAFSVLNAFKEDARLRAIPVLVLTGSSEERDVWRSYQHHANAYIVKPTDARDFHTVLRRIVEFYLGVVLLPPAVPPGEVRE